MLSPYIHAALAQARHQELLAQAEAYRRNRQARLARLRPSRSRLLGRWPGSAVTDRPVVLRDGSAVLIRPVRIADNPAMAGLLRSVRAGLVHREAGALEYEITLGPAESGGPGAEGVAE